jgi:hypothetical protein
LNGKIENVGDNSIVLLPRGERITPSLCLCARHSVVTVTGRVRGTEEEESERGIQQFVQRRVIKDHTLSPADELSGTRWLSDVPLHHTASVVTCSSL